METVKIMYPPAKIITVDNQAFNHSSDKNSTEENKAVIRKLAVKNEHELIAPFCDELHFANYE
jgi:hypothetical protein